MSSLTSALNKQWSKNKSESTRIVFSETSPEIVNAISYVSFSLFLIFLLNKVERQILVKGHYYFPLQIVRHVKTID